VGEPIFQTSISLGSESFQANLSEIEFPQANITWKSSGKKSVNVRNVGHGNWNEVLFENVIKIVYDAGGPLYASKEEILKIIGDRNIIYPQSKPILILSHWDKDHYHSLIGMSIEELKNNFSSFICRTIRPNITSRLLYGKLLEALGSKNIYAINFTKKNSKRRHFSKYMSFGNMIFLYNSQYSKNRNISSLLLLIKTKDNSMLLTADAHYEHISRDILCQLDYKHQHHL
jgi:beta-lactamase superfamily II metal-dependent hydrolase